MSGSCSPKHLALASRLPIAIASVTPVIFVISWSWSFQPGFAWIQSLVALGGVVFLQLGANTINDYFDWTESDAINPNFTPLNGGARGLFGSFMTRRVFLVLSFVYFAIAVVLGITLVFLERKYVLAFGVVGGLCAVFYSVKPFSFQKRGLGEILVFLAFGPLLTMGAGYAATGIISWNYFLLGLPNGFIVTNILLVNEFPDFEADKKTNKRNWVVISGRKFARYLFILLYLLFFLSIPVLYLYDLLSAWNFILYLLTPLAIFSIAKLWREYKSPRALLPAQISTVLFQILTSIIMISIQIIQKKV